MKTSRYLLLLILLLAAILRLINLENTPPPFNVDEALNAYDAYSLLKTGKDQWGNVLPVTIRAFNDYRRPATIYSAIPFITIFDLSIFAIRAVAAFWGWWAIVFMYRLSQDLFGQRTALFAALLLTISPWHIVFSRLGVEVSGPLLTSVIAGLDFAWRWYKHGKDYWLLTSGIAFSLSLYSYTVAQAFTPIFLLSLILIFWSRLRSDAKIGIITGVLITILILPLATSLLLNPLSWNRFEKLSVVNPPYTESLPVFITQWIGYFTPNYLFIQGDANPIHHPPGTGQLLWIEAIFVLLGIIRISMSIFKKKLSIPRDGMHNHDAISNRLPLQPAVIVLVWVILGSLPAALTRQDMGSANAMRGILSLPAWIILSAIGLDTLWGLFTKLSGRYYNHRIIIIFLLLLNVFAVLRYYYVSYATIHARAFEYGIQQAMEYVLEHEEEYNRIILTDWISQPHIFAVFFNKYDPYEFQQNHAVYGTKLSEKLLTWGKKYETGNVEKLYVELEHGLFVVRPHMLEDIEPDLIISHPDGSPAFKIISK